MEAPIRVVARVRPPAANNEDSVCLQVAPAASQIVIGSDNFCDFDAVFSSQTTQKQLYSTCLADIVSNFFEGINTTVLTYGQQSTGKTYTMMGPDILWATNEEEFGLIPQAMRHIFQMMSDKPEREYRVHASYLMVHNESVYDLLSPGPPMAPLKVVEDNMGNIVIPSLTVIDCSNIAEVLNCLKSGLLQRHSASAHSFEIMLAHTIFSVTIEQQWMEAEGHIKYLYSRISFADLTGWEESLNYGMEAFERPMLPHSDLEVLRNVVYCLANKNYNVPYKESRLTHILKDAFGGNSLTLMVCCLSSATKDHDTSYNTLKFGGMTRYVVNHPQINLIVQNNAPISPVTSFGNANRSSYASSLNNNFSLPHPASFLPLAPPPHTLVQPNGLQAPAPIPFIDQQQAGNNVNPDQVFRVQFAASQLELLVSSAEALLSEILQGSSLNATERSRIESWMCMKAEAQDCIGSDFANIQPPSEPNRQLEVIEELSEPNDVSTATEDSIDSESEVSSASSLGEEFYDQLQTLKNKFSLCTKELVDKTGKIRDTCEEMHVLSEQRHNFLNNNSVSAEVERMHIDSPDVDKENRAQNGLLPKDSVPTFPISQNIVKKSFVRNHLHSSYESSVMESEDRDMGDSSENELLKRVSLKLMSVSKGSSRCVDTIRSKSSQLKQSIKSHIFRKKNKSFQFPTDVLGSYQSKTISTTADIKSAQDRLKDLSATIKAKESLMKELKRADNEAQTTRKKCNTDTEQLTKELEAKQELHRHAQSKLMQETNEEGRLNHRKEIDHHRKDINSLQKKMKRLQKVSSVSQNSNANVPELESSLHDLRVQQEELQTLLREGIQRKQQLDLRIIREDRSARNPLCTSKLSDEEYDMKVSTHSIGAILAPSKKRKYLSSTGESEEKFMVTENQCVVPDPSGFSHEIIGQISSLRDAIDILFNKRQKLNRKLRKSSAKNCMDERQILEFDEAVEGLDFVKERLGLSLCGSSKHLEDVSLLYKYDLVNVLKSIPIDELYHVLVRYFNRIVDLRIEFRKQELLFAELENQHESQKESNSNLISAYQQASLKMDREITSRERTYLNEMSILRRQFNLDSTGKAFYEAQCFKLEQQAFYYKEMTAGLKAELNRLKRRSKQTEPTAGTSAVRPRLPLHAPPTRSRRLAIEEHGSLLELKAIRPNTER